MNLTYVFSFIARSVVISLCFFIRLQVSHQNLSLSRNTILTCSVARLLTKADCLGLVAYKHYGIVSLLHYGLYKTSIWGELQPY